VRVSVVTLLATLGQTVVIALMVTSGQLFAILGLGHGVRPVFELFCFFAASTLLLLVSVVWHDLIRNKSNYRFGAFCVVSFCHPYGLPFSGFSVSLPRDICSDCRHRSCFHSFAVLL
jgi:hypothetical protein